jgi:periplasmic divalent cation tolerance protein
MNELMVVLSTCSNVEEAARIGHALVEERLAGCVQIMPPMQSVYRWRGAVESATEQLLLIKTTAEHFSRVEARVKELHSYEVPEVIGLPVGAASVAYAGWLSGELDG